MKLRTIRLQSNPRPGAKGPKRRRRKKAVPAPAAAKRPARRPRRRPPLRTLRESTVRKLIPKGHPWILEAMQTKKTGYAFSYWKGTKFTATRGQAKKFATEKDAHTYAQTLIKRLAASYRLLRVVPA